MLELGCGNGSNLNPMAYSLPGSTFLGVDYALAPIDEARRMVAECGLTNVEFRHQDIRDVDASIGTFDYVICHGVYSWVPPEVADRLLAAIGAVLAPNGVAFVSYNTLPGCHMRRVVWEMLKYHTRNLADICSGLQACADRRSWRCGLLRPFHGAA